MTDVIYAFGNVSDPTFLAPFIEAYGYWFVYLGTVFFGEIIILTSFILSGQGFFDAGLVFILSILGTLTADLFWYITGRLSLHVFKGTIQEPPTHTLSRLLHALTGRYLLLTLLGSKFIIGGRLITILYVARAKASFPLIALFDVLGVTLFIATLALVGWASGKGVNLFFPHHPIIASVGVLFFVVAVVWVSERFLRKKLDRAFVQKT
ncbi:MAG: hypothetical protein Q7R54_03345 [bacterium]|nr:hypothetical protein [bacterium]